MRCADPAWSSPVMTWANVTSAVAARGKLIIHRLRLRRGSGRASTGVRRAMPCRRGGARTQTDDPTGTETTTISAKQQRNRQGQKPTGQRCFLGLWSSPSTVTSEGQADRGQNGICGQQHIACHARDPGFDKDRDADSGPRSTLRQGLRRSHPEACCRCLKRSESVQHHVRLPDCSGQILGTGL